MPYISVDTDWIHFLGSIGLNKGFNPVFEDCSGQLAEHEFVRASVVLKMCHSKLIVLDIALMPIINHPVDVYLVIVTETDVTVFRGEEVDNLIHISLLDVNGVEQVVVTDNHIRTVVKDERGLDFVVLGQLLFSDHLVRLDETGVPLVSDTNVYRPEPIHSRATDTSF